MPVVKIYSIVTNDEYELPIGVELEGAKAVGEFLGLKEGTVRINLMNDKWGKKKYKAFVSGQKEFDKKTYERERSKRRTEMEKMKLITDFLRKE